MDDAVVASHMAGHFVATPSPPQRNPRCPGYKLYKKTHESEAKHPVEGRNYEANGLPFTQICKHDPCEEETEYEYYLCKLISTGTITENQWILLRPIS